MNRNTALTWSWLNVVTKKRYDALCDVYEDLDAALGVISENLLKSLGCREDTVHVVLNRLDEFDPEAYEKELARRDITLLSIEDAAYPTQLRTVPDAPIFLYACGDLSILNQPCIALVGTREMSAYGKRVTEEIVPALVRAGIVTVSGLAQGIDTQVAKETLAASGKTVAVLGHGMGSIHPRSNASIARAIIDAGGLILCEYPLDMAPDKYTFPARNRIIAGLSLGTVLLEAGEGSGALITADLALDYNRDVYAVPGQIFDPHVAGCHNLIARGHARLITSAEDILKEIGIVASQEEASSYAPKDAIEQALLKVLTSMPQSVSSLVEKAGVQPSSVNASLTMMELAGAAKNVGNGMWVKG